MRGGRHCKYITVKMLNCTALYCHSMLRSELHCTTKHLTTLHCTALYWPSLLHSALQSTTKYFTTLHLTALPFTVLPLTIQLCTTLNMHWVAPLCTAWHLNMCYTKLMYCTALHCTSLHYTANSSWPNRYHYWLCPSFKWKQC